MISYWFTRKGIAVAALALIGVHGPVDGQQTKSGRLDSVGPWIFTNLILPSLEP